MNERPTYMQMIDFIYRNNYPEIMKSKAVAVAHAIMYKSSQLLLPSDFQISNQELSRLSGNNISDIGRVRQKVVDTCVYDGTPIFSYRSQRRNHYGKYGIKYPIISQYYHDIDVIRSQYDHNKIIYGGLLNNNKENSTKETNKWLMNQLMNISPGWGGPTNPAQRDQLDAIARYPEQRIGVVVKRAAENGIRGHGMLTWILKGLDNFDRLYRNMEKPAKTKQHRTPESEKANKIAFLNEVYAAFKDGVAPESGRYRKPPEIIPQYLKNHLRSVKEHEAGLDFTVGDYKAVIARWETAE